jgi:hypothetical protein
MLAHPRPDEDSSIRADAPLPDSQTWEAAAPGEAMLDESAAETRAEEASPSFAAHDLQDERLVLTLEQRTLHLQPGESATLQATLLNNGESTAQFYLQIEGSLREEWVTIAPAHTQLRPGERTSFTVTIAPPRLSTSRAGDFPIYISARSPSHPHRRTRLRALVHIEPFIAFSLGELHPAQLHASWHAPDATTLLPVTNQSNLDAQIYLEGSDGRSAAARTPGHQRTQACRMDFMLPGTATPRRDRALIALGPGQTVHVPVRIAPRRRHWFGVTRRHIPFRITGWIAAPPPAAPPEPAEGPTSARNPSEHVPNTAPAAGSAEPGWSAARTVTGRLTCIPLIGPGLLTAFVGCALAATLAAGIVAFVLLLALLIPNLRESPPPAAAPPSLPAEVEIVVKIAEPVPTADPAAAAPPSEPRIPVAQAAAATAAPGANAVPVQSDTTVGPEGVPIVQPDMVTAPGEPAPATGRAQANVPTPVVVTADGAAVAAPPSRGDGTTITYEQMFRTVAASYELDWRLLAAQAYVESSFNPVALGTRGDLGLMQVMPATWQEWAPRVSATDPFDSYSNVLVAAAYLAYLRDLLADRGYEGIEWALVAYNWGPAQLQEFLDAGRTWADLDAAQRKYAEDITGIAASLPAQ